MSNKDQIAWLDRQAKYRGLEGFEALPEALFTTLAAMWRRVHRN